MAKTPSDNASRRPSELSAAGSSGSSPWATIARCSAIGAVHQPPPTSTGIRDEPGAMRVPCREAPTGSAQQAKGRERRGPRIRRPFMTVQRLEHIGIVVDDLAAATAFFAALGLEVEGETSVEGELVDRIN